MSFVLPRAVRLLRGTQSQACHYRCLQSLVNHSRPSAPLSNSGQSTKRSFHASTSFSSIKNPYMVLGVPKTASAAEIKSAYYGLARQWHPDTNKEPQAREKFQELQAAYEILRDPEKKTMFDQHGESAFDPSGGFNPGAGAGGFGGHPSGFSGFGGGGFGADLNFEDLFNAFSGATQGGKRGRGFQDVVVGDNIELQTTISFMEAAKGAEKDIITEPLITCKTCSGSGLKQGEKRKNCGRCGGSGTRIHYMAAGFQMSATCDTCSGEGVVMPRGAECRTCNGAGVTKETRSVHIDIPPGIEDGMRLRVSGEGHTPPASSPSARTMRGDLYIHVKVATHKDFGRKGADVTYTATLPFTTAILGGKITIPTLDGEVDLKVREGTNSGDKVTIPGAGMKKIGKSKCGDLKIEYKINLPKTFTHTQRTLLELLADEFKDPDANRIMNVTLNQPNSASDSGTGNNKDPTENRPGHSSFLKRLFNSITHHEDKDKPPRNSGAPEDEESSKKASGSGSG